MLNWFGGERPAARPFPLADSRLASELELIRSRLDGYVSQVLVFQWALVMIASFTLLPDESLLAKSHWTVHLWNGLLTLAPLWMLLRFELRRETRWTLAVSQGVYSTMLLCESGGQPATLAHLFVWLLILSLYRDHTMLLASGVSAVVTQGIVSFTTGMSELAFISDWAWREHISWLTVEVACLTWFTKYSVRMMANLARREAALDSLNKNIDRKVEVRTRQFQEAQKKLAAENEQLRDIRMKSQADEVAATRSLLDLRESVNQHASNLMDVTWQVSDSMLPEAIRDKWRIVRDTSQDLMNLITSEDSAFGQVQSSIGIEQFNGKSSSELLDKLHSELDESVGTNSVSADKRALLLMDDPVQTSLTVSALEVAGFRVSIVRSGPRLYYSTQLNDYDAILIDVDLLNDEGLDTIEALRTMPGANCSNSKVVAIASSRDSELVLKLAEFEIDGLLLKPVSPDDIHRVLGNLGAKQFTPNEVIDSFAGSI